MIKCYCDASYDPSSKIAICGWQISNGPIQTFTLTNTKNTRAEIIGLIHLINIVNNQPGNFIIYTDCESIIRIINNREKLVNKNFCNKKGVELEHADIYRDLFMIISDKIQIEHISGHV